MLSRAKNCTEDIPVPSTSLAWTCRALVIDFMLRRVRNRQCYYYYICLCICIHNAEKLYINLTKLTCKLTLLRYFWTRNWPSIHLLILLFFFFFLFFLFLLGRCCSDKPKAPGSVVSNRIGFGMKFWAIVLQINKLTHRLMQWNQNVIVYHGGHDTISRR